MVPILDLRQTFAWTGLIRAHIIIAIQRYCTFLTRTLGRTDHNRCLQDVGTTLNRGQMTTDLLPGNQHTMNFSPTFPCFLFLVFSFSLIFGFKPKCILIGCWAVLLGPEVSQCPSVPVSQVAQVFSNGSVRDTVSPNDKLGTSPGNALTDFAVLGSAK